MSGVTKAIGEELYKKAEEALKEVGRSRDVSRKIQAIKSAKEHGIKKVAEIFGVSRVAIMSWIESFDKRGIEGLKIKSGRGRKSLITEEEKGIIKGWLLNNSNMTIKELKLKIEEAFGKKLCMSAVHVLIKNLDFSYITPRPVHHKKAAASSEVFKKKSRELSKRKP